MKIGRVLRRVTLKGVMRAGNVKMLVSLASLGMLVMVFFCAREARGQTTRPTAPRTAGPNIVGPYRADPKVDGRFYVVERFELEYLKHRKGEALGRRLREPQGTQHVAQQHGLRKLEQRAQQAVLLWMARAQRLELGRTDAGR